MTENILGTEVNEFLTNRQNAKIQYLQRENDQLLEDIADLQQALKLNKDALMLAYDHKFLKGQLNELSNNSQSTVACQNNIQLNNEELIKKLNAENAQLLVITERVTKERNAAQSNALIQRQISEEQENFHKMILTELEEKILELRRIIHDKEYAIQELEKLKPQTDPKDGTVTKIREIITPNEQSLKLHAEMEVLRETIYKQTQENQQYQSQIQHMHEYCRNIKREVVKVKLTLLNPVNYNKMREFIFNENAMALEDKIEMQQAYYKEFMNGQDNSDESEEKEKQQTKTHKDYRYREHEVQSQGMNQMQKTTILQEKISKLEASVRNYKVLFSREINNNLQLCRDQEKLQRFNKQCSDQHDMLLNSNNIYKQRHEKQIREINYFKSFFIKYHNSLRHRNKRVRSMDNFDENNILKDKKIKLENEVLMGPRGSRAESSQADKNYYASKEIQKNEDEYDQNDDSKNTQGNIYPNIADLQNHSDLTLFEAKQFLISLSKDLNAGWSSGQNGITQNVLKKVQQNGLNQSGTGNLFRFKRSLSSPLDYISKDVESLYQVQKEYQINKKKIQKKSSAANNNAIIPEENESDDDKNNKNPGKEQPFFVDMSVIQGEQVKIKKQQTKKGKQQRQILVDVSFISNDGDIVEQFNQQ